MRLESPLVATVNIDQNKATLGSSLSTCQAYLVNPKRYAKEFKVRQMEVRLEVLKYVTMKGYRWKVSLTLIASTPV